MRYVITGATGNLGRLVVQSLLDKGVQPGLIVATGRSIIKLDDLAARGVLVRAADFDDSAVLNELIEEGDRVLLVSGAVPGVRVDQHAHVIAAAKDRGAALVAYTSIIHADRLDIALARDHQATERLLAASGVPHALLRNNLYLDLYVDQAASFADQGFVLGARGAGRLSAALRSEFAEAAAAVLLEGRPGTYELAGDESFSFAELAAAVTEATGRRVEYRELSVDQYAQALAEAGMPRPVAEIMADVERGAAAGQLDAHDGTLAHLLGRPTTTLAQALEAATR